MGSSDGKIAVGVLLLSLELSSGANQKKKEKDVSKGNIWKT